MRQLLNTYGYEIVECEPQVRTISASGIDNYFTFAFPRMLFLKRPPNASEDWFNFHVLFLNKPFEDSQHVFFPYLVKQDMTLSIECLHHEDQLQSKYTMKELIALFWQTKFGASLPRGVASNGINKISTPAAFPQDKMIHCAKLLRLSKHRLQDFFQIQSARKLLEETKHESVHLFDEIVVALGKVKQR